TTTLIASSMRSRALVERIRRARAFEYVLHALAAGQALYRFHRVVAADINDMVGAEFFTKLEASVAGAGQDDGLGAQCLGDADAHLDLVDCRAELHDRAHIFVARGEALVERQPTIDHRLHAMPDDLDIGRADGDRVNSNEHLGGPRLQHRLLDERELIGTARHPSLHCRRTGYWLPRDMPAAVIGIFISYAVKRHLDPEPPGVAYETSQV